MITSLQLRDHRWLHIVECADATVRPQHTLSVVKNSPALVVFELSIYVSSGHEQLAFITDSGWYNSSRLTAFGISS